MATCSVHGEPVLVKVEKGISPESATPTKVESPKRDLQSGDIVILTEDNVPRNKWKLARVEETLLCVDGMVRKVKLAIGDTELDKKGKRVHPQTYLERPVHKLILLMENPENTD